MNQKIKHIVLALLLLINTPSRAIQRQIQFALAAGTAIALTGAIVGLWKVFFATPAEPEMPTGPTELEIKAAEIEQFSATLTDYEQVTFDQIDNSDLWADRFEAFGAYDPFEKIFNPFMQKLVIEAYAQVFVFGDTHADTTHLDRAFANLQAKGVLTENLEITDPEKYYFVFLGDYIDRGPSSIGVLQKIWQLKINNPNNVVLLRGNHDDNLSGQYYGNLARELEGNEKLVHNTYNSFRTLPCALFVQRRGDNNVVLCCHGGPEMGLNPELVQNLLSAKGPIKFSHLGVLDRNSAITDLPRELGEELTEKIECGIAEYTYFTLEKYPEELEEVAFAWADIAPEDCQSVYQYSMRRFAYSTRLVRAILDRYTKGTDFVITNIIRGHQHNISMPNIHQGLCTTYGNDTRICTVFSMGPPYRGMSERYNYLSLQKEEEWNITQHVDGETLSIPTQIEY